MAAVIRIRSCCDETGGYSGKDWTLLWAGFREMGSPAARDEGTVALPAGLCAQAWCDMRRRRAHRFKSFPSRRLHIAAPLVFCRALLHQFTPSIATDTHPCTCPVLASLPGIDPKIPDHREARVRFSTPGPPDHVAVLIRLERCSNLLRREPSLPCPTIEPVLMALSLSSWSLPRRRRPDPFCLRRLLFSQSPPQAHAATSSVLPSSPSRLASDGIDLNNSGHNAVNPDCIEPRNPNVVDRTHPSPLKVTQNPDLPRRCSMLTVDNTTAPSYPATQSATVAHLCPRALSSAVTASPILSHNYSLPLARAALI
ncbi:hypothetical protein M0R45_005049 [Rubus argutus]|uniref:Uncharacterized protein n=1 Tax=Rubus argutus TaxID=59490 RepID=A0AAW1YLP9_RUBAR